MQKYADYIKQIEIDALWSGRKHIIWDLDRQVNILSGVNGVGKSTILNKVVKGLSAGGDFPSHLLKGVHLKVEPEDARLIRFDIIRSFDRPIINSDAVTKMGLTLATEMDWQIFLLQRKYLDYQVNIGNRIIATLQSGEPDAAEKAQALSQPKKDFQDIMDSLFAETGKKIIRTENEIKFTQIGETLLPYQLSSGEKQILVILLTVLVEDQKNYVLFMDEPEVSLHVEWQKQLIDLILRLNPNVQIILTTHSPAVIMNGWMDKVTEVSDWRQILSQFETDTLYFEIMLPSRMQHLERGKKAVLMRLLSGKTGQSMIACVDADYDYLIQGKTETSRAVISNPYVFHTYAYAIENMQCYAPSLHEVCVAVTLNDHSIFDMEEYLRQYSRAIYPLFVWNIWYYRTPHYNDFTLTEFLRIIEPGGFSLSNPWEPISRVKQKAEKKVAQLWRIHPNEQRSYQQVEDSLKELGVTPDNTYMYIQGHHLFDKVVVPMLSKVCEKLVRQRQSEIARESVHGTQRRNELSCYTNSLTDITSMLKKNAGFLRSPQYHQIEKDLKTFVERCNKQPNESLINNNTTNTPIN